MTTKLIAHKIELRPTATQAEYLRRCCGTMRFVYNKLVEKWKSGEKYNRKDFQKFCTSLRQSTPWMQTVTARATYEAVDNFHAAVNRFFKKVASGGGKSKPPKFKKKGLNESFQLSYSTQFKISGRKLKIHHRTFNCPYCDSSLNRDLNAAINIDRYKSTSPLIKGRSKTTAQDLCKTVSAAELFEGGNTNSTRKGGIAAVANN